MNQRQILCAVLLAAGLPAVEAEAAFTEAPTGTLSFPLNGNTRSVSLADVDNDGDLDALYQGSLGSGLGRRFFRNLLVPSGTFSFADQTASGPVASDTTGWSAAWADVNGDGFVDVFLGETNSGAGVRGDFFLNNAGASFQDVSATTINDPGFHQNVAWADMNNDQLLDMVMGMEGPERHEIYLQGPNMTFQAVGAAAGIQVDYGTKAYGMAVADADRDGDVDFYISTCRGGGNIRNNFFRNNLIETGAMTFTDVADTNGTQYMDNSYHAEFQDFDNDGWLDLFMIGADGFDSKIWRNDQDGTFTDVATILGKPLLSNNGGDLNGGRAVDYDHDGDLDLFFHDNTDSRPTDYARLLYRNDGNWEFVDVTSTIGLHNSSEYAYDSAWGDLDLDGDMDLITAAESGQTKRVFLNDAATNGNNWAQIRLVGETWNTRAVGATLVATIHQGTPQEVRLTRLANTNAGTFNQSDLPVHFGLGTATVIDELEIRWPDGTVETWSDLPVNEYETLTQGDTLTTASDGFVVY